MKKVIALVAVLALFGLGCQIVVKIQDESGIMGMVKIEGSDDVGSVLIVAEPQVQGKTVTVLKMIGDDAAPLPKGIDGNVYTVLTDAGGEYELLGLPEGVYTVTAYKQHTLGAVYRNVTVSAKAVTQVDIVLTATGSVSGKIELKGHTDFSGTFVWTEGTSYLAATTAGGNFKIDNIPVGRYRIIMYHEGYVQENAIYVDVTAGATIGIDKVVLNSATGAIRGRVSLGGTEYCLGVTVGLAGTSHSAMTDNEGFYFIGGIKPGTYTVAANKAGYDTAAANDIPVEAGAEIEVNLSLSQNPMSLIPVAPPAFSVPGGTYNIPYPQTLSVSISTSTPGASINYTLDDSEPTAAHGTLYTKPLSLKADLILKAITFVANGWLVSEVTSAQYFVSRPFLGPSFDPPGGTYSRPQIVRLSAEIPSGSPSGIVYTMDGTTPVYGINSIPYTAPIYIEKTTMIKAFAFALDGDGIHVSDISTTDYIIDIDISAIEPPILSAGSGTYQEIQYISIVSQTAEASIRFTLDGTEPSYYYGIRYTGPIPIESTTTLKTVAYAYVNDAWMVSTVTTADYIIDIIEPPPPVEE